MNAKDEGVAKAPEREGQEEGTEEKKTTRQRRLEQMRKDETNVSKAMMYRDRKQCPYCKTPNWTAGVECRKCKLPYYIMQDADIHFIVIFGSMPKDDTINYYTKCISNYHLNNSYNYHANNTIKHYINSAYIYNAKNISSRHKYNISIYYINIINVYNIFRIYSYCLRYFYRNYFTYK